MPSARASPAHSEHGDLMLLKIIEHCGNADPVLLCRRFRDKGCLTTAAAR
jgi:hypothetical protein